MSTRSAIDLLLTMLRSVRRHLGDVALVSEEPWSGLLTRLAPSWRADGRNRDKARFLLAPRRRAPFASVLSSIDDSSVEYAWRARAAMGLGAAHLVEGLAVSLALNPVWDVVTWRATGGTGPEPDWLTHVVPEHEQRRRLCRFDDPDTGTHDLFHQYLRCPPTPGRLHFRWDASTEKVILAHVGRNLGV